MHYRAMVDGMHADRVTAFRVNSLVPGHESAISELLQMGLDVIPVDAPAGAAFVPPEHRSMLLESDPFVSGRVYIQSLSSMLPVPILAPEPGEILLDLAAAPGSKTLQLAAAAPGADIAAVELVKKRMYKLRDNLSQNGAPDVKVFLQDGTKVWRYRPEHFDRVLIDAPCSSEGRFLTSDPETTAYWSPRKVKEMVRKQRRLLYSAIRATRPGGVIVYSTCAITPDENEGVIQAMLDAFPEHIEVEPLPESVWSFPERIPAIREWKKTEYSDAMEGCLRILPSDRMEGFFVCRLRKLAPITDEALPRRTS